VRLLLHYFPPRVNTENIRYETYLSPLFVVFSRLSIVFSLSFYHHLFQARINSKQSFFMYESCRFFHALCPSGGTASLHRNCSFNTVRFIFSHKKEYMVTPTRVGSVTSTFSPQFACSSFLFLCLAENQNQKTLQRRRSLLASAGRYFFSLETRRLPPRL